MLNQNYMQVFINSGETVTIAAGEPNENPLEPVTVNYVTIGFDDLFTLSETLNNLARQIDEEQNNV